MKSDRPMFPLPLPRMALFAIAALLPFALLGIGLWQGGMWVWAALIYMAGLSAVLDALIPWVAPDAPEGTEFPAADTLLAAIAIGHLMAFPLAIWAIAGDSGLPSWARVGLFLGFGHMFGQISNPAAHELIHRGDKRLFRLGMAIYITLLNGHHTSAHRLVHHRLAATAEDPNTARLGESYYAFLPRAYFGGFRAGLAAENRRRQHGSHGIHPYILYTGGGLVCLALGSAIAGLAGILVWIGLGFYATAFLMLSDYVQHYGLTRRMMDNGKPEPVSDRHSWNAPHWFSSGVMLNAPRHSDHHAHPARPYPALRLPGPDEAPWLPYSLPVCSVIALFPPRWRRMMRPHLARWREG